MRFLKVSSDLITDENINANEFRVYTYLMSLYNEKDGCSYPSIETIAKKVNISSRTVKKCIKHLEELGYLVIGKRKGTKGNFNTYSKFKHIIKNLKNNMKKKEDPKEKTLEEELIEETGRDKETVVAAIKEAVKKGANNIKAYAKVIIENTKHIKEKFNPTGFSNFRGRNYTDDDYKNLERELLGW